MKFQLMLAPMEGIGNCAFRTLCHENGADLTFSEMARVANLARGKKGEIDKIKIMSATPTQIQLAGAKLSDYKKFLLEFEPENGFGGFNLNLGCPSPSFIRQGIGAAMIKRVSRVKEIVGIIKEHGFECSIKLRLGLNKYEKEKGAYLNLIENVDAQFFVVHAKTADQEDKEAADFSVYEKCVKTGKKIVANGDIKTKEQVLELKNAGLYGAMIGRAAIKNPKIFAMMKKSL
ncbi:MAG: tRNA-dihydrouridine synthase family protein [Candidatus Micrarchaeia archaeon]